MTRKDIVDIAVKSLQDYAFKTCTAKNITTDEVFKEFFKQKLENAKGLDAEADVIIDGLLAEIAG